MMDSPNVEGEKVGASAGVRNGAGESIIAPTERVPGGGEPHPAFALAVATSTVGSGTGKVGGDRQEGGTQGSGRGSACREAGYDSTLVSKTDR